DAGVPDRARRVRLARRASLASLAHRAGRGRRGHRGHRGHPPGAGGRHRPALRGVPGAGAGGAGRLAGLRLVRHHRERAEHRHPELVPGDRRARHDLRDHQRRDRPVGRLGVRARRRAGRVRDALGEPGRGAAAAGRLRGDRPAQRRARRVRAAGAVHRHAGHPARRPRPAAGDHRRGLDHPGDAGGLAAGAAGAGLGPRPGLAGVDRGGAVRPGCGRAQPDPDRAVGPGDRRQPGRGAADGAAGGPAHHPALPGERAAGRAGRCAGRGVLGVRGHDRRRRAGAGRHRRRGHRGHAAHRRRRHDRRHAVRGAAAAGHPERDQPDRDAGVVVPVGGQRGLPGRGRGDPGVPEPGAAAV
ncbi:MAG: Ribose ABC transport system, permease protein RbsC, partial [uncultured Corynebacteriales bacterium]